VQGLEVQQSLPAPESLVRLLQRHDVRIEFEHHVEHPVGIEDAVGADAFMHIVGGDRYGERRLMRLVGRPFLADQGRFSTCAAGEIPPQGGNDVFHSAFIPVRRTFEGAG
jgi:hypothetical protein